MHYQQVVTTPRYEDFDMTYNDKNRFAHLGMGWTLENRLGIQNADQSPYINREHIDPRWLDAVGSDPEKAK